MSVIGPADLLRTIHKDGNMIQAVVLNKEKGAEASRPPPPRRAAQTNSQGSSHPQNDPSNLETEEKEGA
jgi:hypothetical protein